MADIFKSRDGVIRENSDLGNNAYAEVVSTSGFNSWTISFTKASASGINSPDMTQVFKSAGFAVSQTGGNALIVSSTTANEEFLAVSNKSFVGSLIARGKTILSQRIANNNFAVLLADKIGDNLPVTINSATSITVTIPGTNPFTADNVGQFVNVAALTGMSGAVPGRYAIASVSGNMVNFTVAGWPASGTGTCTLFGWNYYRNLYTGVTATNTSVDAQRYGYATGDTVATINTTASPGHMWQWCIEGRQAYFDDSLVASTTAPAVLTRASRYENLPDIDTPLYVYIWAFNGSAAPASTTTWTLGFLSVESFINNPVYIGGIRLLGAHGLLPVTVSSGTITTVSTVTSITTNGTPAVPATPYFVNSAATTNGALVLTGTSGMCAFYASNTGATAAFVKLYNKATAPTVGTDIPEMVIPVPAAVSGVPGFVELAPGFNGYRFALGLGIAITGGSADSDTTAVAAGQVKVKLSRTV